MKTIQNFLNKPFSEAIKTFFEDLRVPINHVSDLPTSANEVLQNTFKENDSFHLIQDVYFTGIVDDASFEGNLSINPKKIKSDYDGILLFGVTLKERKNKLLPTRMQLAEIARAFNREFFYTPVIVIFKYGNYLAFANTERLKYKQEWREGEKAGKVTLLRDVNIENPHSGHLRILFGDGKEKGLQIDKSKVDSFDKLYKHWQEVFSTNLLNKKFYQELSTWYFWATKQVVFPGEPTLEDAHNKNAKLEDLIQEHKATNVIRMLTRLLFVWFIKEKKLIPEEIFDLETLQKDILNEISPFHDETSMFKGTNKDSIYYKAVLQNLFFATLNCPIEGDNLDTRKRSFRGDGYGTHRGIDYLMRYKQYFKNPEKFLKTLNGTVPFLNGGLFECLDDKFNNIYIDGFSDQMTKGEQLIVPDYLFFGVSEETDISDVVGISDKKHKKAAVKGLINILKSYKFTITENTPIEEDVALDPELLGKVFENLLASYNPETKTTARKQTGSFYTPREIVNYMVDESLIAYLKNAIKDWGGLDDETLEKELHLLTSFDSKIPFSHNPYLQKNIISALSTCTILDPACGSGAFPMGILQKMVYILQKLDPENKVWKDVQLAKARKESEEAFEIEDKKAREERLIEINEAFDQSINDPDYARKLFLIENCIYGVDIQPIATQISKLRFFISLVVEQKVIKERDNFGIRPLPNLETKFVAANTLIGIKKENSLFYTDEIKNLEKELKLVRHKLFSARTKDTKLKYRQKDKELRQKIASILEKGGMPLNESKKLAGWDPYDQNNYSSFFDPEWMFDIKDGFDVVIGNPPYISFYSGQAAKISDEMYNDYVKQYDFIENKKSKSRLGTVMMFLEKSHKITKKSGLFTFIIDLNIFSDAYIPIRKYLQNKLAFKEIINNLSEFENVGSGQIILRCDNHFDSNSIINIFSDFSKKELLQIPQNRLNKENNYKLKFSKYELIISQIEEQSNRFEDVAHIISGMNIGGVKEYFLSEVKKDDSYHKAILSGNIFKYFIKYPNEVQIRNPRNLFIKFDKKLEKYIWDNNLGTPSIGADENKFKQPKLLLRRPLTSDGKLAAAYSDDIDHYSDVTVYIVNQKSKNLFLLLGIINSKLATFYSKQTGIIKADKGQQPQITINKFKDFPIKESLLKLEDSIIILSKLLTYSSSTNELICLVLDALIFNMYFPSHMKEREIDVFEFVEKDINEVFGERDIDKLDNMLKENVIKQLHEKWSHPDNEVRNRIKLFAVRSPDIIKPILEN